MIFSVNKHISVFGWEKHREGLITYFLYLVIFLSIITFVKSKKQLLDITVYLSLGVFLNNLFGIYQMLFNNFGEGIMYGQRIITTFDDPNLLGGFTILALPLILAAIYLTDDKKIRLFTIFNALLTFVILIFSGSRSALMGLLISLLIFVIYLKKLDYKSLIGFIFGLLIIVANPFLLSRLKLAVFKSDLIARLNAMKGSLKYITANPLFGTGPDTFKFFTGNYGGFGGAHNEIINIAQTLGLLGLVAFLLIFFYVLLKGVQYTKSKEKYSVLYLISTTSFLIFLFFNYSNPVINIFFWISMALIVCLNNMEMKKMKTIRLPKLNFLLPFVTILCFILIYLAVRIPIGVIYYRQGQMNEDAGRYTEAVAKYKLAVSMVPDSEIFLKGLGYLTIKLAKNGYTTYLPIAKESFDQINKNVSPNDPDVYRSLKELKKVTLR